MYLCNVFSSVPNERGIFYMPGFAGAYSAYTMGDKNFYTSRLWSSCLCICGNISDDTSSIYTINVDCWDDIWLWLWVSTNHLSCSCWCIATLLYWTTLLPQNSSMCQPSKAASFSLESIIVSKFNFARKL